MSGVFHNAYRKCGRCAVNFLNNTKGGSMHRVYKMICPKCTTEMQEKRAAKQTA
jgi:hypothetical protein